MRVCTVKLGFTAKCRAVFQTTAILTTLTYCTAASVAVHCHECEMLLRYWSRGLHNPYLSAAHQHLGYQLFSTITLSPVAPLSPLVYQLSTVIRQLYFIWSIASCTRSPPTLMLIEFEPDVAKHRSRRCTSKGGEGKFLP